MIRFVKTTDKDNVYGDEVYEIIQFNFDGDGSALMIAKNDGKEDVLIEYGHNDLLCMMGLNEDEHPVCYKIQQFRNGVLI